MKQQEVSVASVTLYRETDDMLTVDKDKENTPSRTLAGSRSPFFEEIWDFTPSEKWVRLAAALLCH